MQLLEKYEIAFGIQTEIGCSPITLSTKSEATELYVDGLYEKTVSRLLKYKVCEMTNMSLEELLNLPTFKLQTIMRAIINLREEEKIAIENEKNKIPGN